MTSVAIVGLKPNQADKIRTEYSDQLDLKFILANTPAKQIRLTAESSDHVVLMTKFIDHETTDAVRKHDGVTFCNGGMSSLQLKLDDLIGC